MYEWYEVMTYISSFGPRISENIHQSVHSVQSAIVSHVRKQESAEPLMPRLYKTKYSTQYTKSLNF